MSLHQDNLWQTDLFVLASGSATRKAMLKAAGLDFIAEASDVDEASIKISCKAKGLDVAATAMQLALAKAARVCEGHKGRLVLGCDQMLECEGRWLDKAEAPHIARDQLSFLSGKTHRLITAAVLLRDGQIIWQKTKTASLTMRALSPAFIDSYMGRMGEKLLASVGCYALEGLGCQLFTKIEGNHFVILGLPLLSFLEALRKEGILSS